MNYRYISAGKPASDLTPAQAAAVLTARYTPTHTDWLMRQLAKGHTVPLGEWSQISPAPPKP